MATEQNNEQQSNYVAMDDLYCAFGEVCNGRPLNEIFSVAMVFLRDVHKMMKEAQPEMPELLQALTEAYTMLAVKEAEFEVQENEQQQTV